MFNRVTDISVSFLQKNGITALLLDVDNTIITYKGDKLIDGFLKWKEEMQSAGIKILILSNGKSERLKLTAKKAGLDFVPMACKPLPFKYLKAIKILKEKRKSVAIVGDQVFTDILGGKLIGINTFLLRPIRLETTTSFKIRRYFENKLYKAWGKEVLS